MGCRTHSPAGSVCARRFIRYLTAVVKGLWRSGFRRILIWNTHGGNFYAMRTFPNEVFAGMASGDDRLWDEYRGGGRSSSTAGGGGAVAAACRMLGREDLVTKIGRTTGRRLPSSGPAAGATGPPAARLAEAGHVEATTRTRHSTFSLPQASARTPVSPRSGRRRHVAGLVEDFGRRAPSLGKGGHNDRASPGCRSPACCCSRALSPVEVTR
jgi:hypothetical protein